MRIAIYGGSFDPIHNAHVALTQFGALYFDKLIVVPAYQSPFKSQKSRASAKQRMEMCRLAFLNSGIADVEISNYEIERNETVYTYETLEHFKSLYPNDQLVLIMGSDLLSGLKEWKNPEILAKYPIVVVPRAGFYEDLNKNIEDFKALYGGEFTVTKRCDYDIRSSIVRLRNSYTSLSGLVSPEVEKYIKQNGLYNDFLPYAQALNNYNLSKERIQHTYGTAETAVILATQHNVDADKSAIAGLLHDIGKSMTFSRASEKGYKLNAELLEAPAPCHHCEFGALIAEHELNVKDEDILNAIRNHTTARPNMSELEKIIFISDYIEPNRDGEIPNLEPIRRLASVDLNKTVLTILKATLNRLNGLNRLIDKRSQLAYEFYKQINKEEV